MNRRDRTVFLLAFGIIVAAGALVVLLNVSARPMDSSTAPSTVGVVVGIDAEGLDRVKAFELRTPDGSITTFVMGELENGANFPPGHLGEHQATAEPVRVFYREDGATKIAIRIDDAS